MTSHDRRGRVVVAGFLAAAIRVATPLLLAALGEMIAERSGVINLGMEGGDAGRRARRRDRIRGRALGGLAAATGGRGALALIFALGGDRSGGRPDHRGHRATLVAVGYHGCGISGVRLGRGGVDPSDARRGAAGGLARAARGPGALQPAGDHLRAIVAVPITGGAFRTRSGLALRAAGEGAVAARAAGVPVRAIRAGATLVAASSRAWPGRLWCWRRWEPSRNG